MKRPEILGDSSWSWRGTIPRPPECHSGGKQQKPAENPEKQAVVSGSAVDAATSLSVADELNPKRSRRGPRGSGGVEACRAAARARWADRPSFAATIAAQVDRSAGPDACWPWTGGVNAEGYGRFMFDSRSYLAHRAVLAQKLGRPLGEEEVTRHGDSCGGNRLCCNPDHLQPGGIVDNNADLIAQGRQARGEDGGGAKLTDAQVDEILALVPTMSHGRYELLGLRYGVTGKTISNIWRRKRWRHKHADCSKEAA
jgi:hypothetical protein